ncbi:hypothetical protein K437DRAFT_254618 [Tilletiaria anomala UBC 951]|uniref:Transcription and mRNA export factor SUS1 n=1 Tax=Tilletiaria anomala (strain ATCC 24038 / CBS 436.72 / UBC 951) TaxID=1037660 RepID=A0A066WM36_TILAU|nr:uncharacterized protein K437DRAFT_254618 [Tilletiaria anomala UBC 951]KDN52064.1 hypothetical protein K437DRAFT_254618 [Tilletiaria anomala UBC 951]
MSDPTTEEELLEALHQRMVITGTWDRLLHRMRSLLKGTTYEEELSAYALERAKCQEQPDVTALIQVLTPRARKAIPPAVKEAIMAQIMTFLHENLEVDA